MIDFIYHLVYWEWLGFAAALLIVEVLTGSGFLLWIGISAALVGGILFLFPELNWMAQLLIFAVLAILTAVGWKLYLKRYPIRTDRPNLNRRGEQYLNRIFTLDKPIVNGMGMVHVDDTTWRIHCDMDLPAGARIKIIGVNGVILIASASDGN